MTAKGGGGARGILAIWRCCLLASAAILLLSEAECRSTKDKREEEADWVQEDAVVHEDGDGYGAKGIEGERMHEARGDADVLSARVLREVEIAPETEKVEEEPLEDDRVYASKAS